MRSKTSALGVKEIYILVKFELNEGVKIEDWKKMSDGITADMKGTDGLISRESAVDEKWNVYCILKWDTIEQRTVFHDNMMKEMDEKPEMMEEFGKLANMESFTMDILNVL